MIRRGDSSPDRSASWPAALQYALDAVLPEPASTHRARPRARIIAVNPAGAAFEVELRFEAGRTYCCIEPGCFLATSDRHWWSRFRAALRDVSDREPPPLTITIHGVVEAGTTLDALNPAAPERESSTYREGPISEKDSRN